MQVACDSSTGRLSAPCRIAAASGSTYASALSPPPPPPPPPHAPSATTTAINIRIRLTAADGMALPSAPASPARPSPVSRRTGKLGSVSGAELSRSFFEQVVQPPQFDGRPVRFATTRDPRVRHRVAVATVPAFVSGLLGVDATRALDPLDRLALTGQSVLEVTAGPVFHDGPGSLGRVRRRLAWYPHDVWLYVLASGWARIAQEMAFVGRT